MSNTIKPEDLEKELMEYLTDYKEHIDEIVEEKTKTITKRAKEDLKIISPRLTGEYSTGWSIKTIKSANTYTQKIWNKKKYRLTHLLEFGHWIKRDGQIVGYCRPIPHIRPIENKYYEEFISEIEKGAKKW